MTLALRKDADAQSLSANDFGNVMPSQLANYSAAHMELAERLHFRLFRLMAALRRYEYDQAAPSALTLTQCSLLYRLREQQSIRMSDLAAHDRVAVPTMSKAVGKLEALGMACRTRGAADARNVLVGITPKGVRAQQQAVADLLEGMLTSLGPDEIVALEAALASLERLPIPAPKPDSDPVTEDSVEDIDASMRRGGRGRL